MVLRRVVLTESHAAARSLARPAFISRQLHNISCVFRGPHCTCSVPSSASPSLCLEGGTTRVHFDRQKHQGTERLSELPKVTQLITGAAGAGWDPGNLSAEPVCGDTGRCLARHHWPGSGETLPSGETRLFDFKVHERARGCVTAKG